MNTLKKAGPMAAAIIMIPLQVLATPILGPELSAFVVLGAETVTNTGATTLTGNLGVSPGTAITGKSTMTVDGVNADLAGNTSVHENDTVAAAAQAQLTAAITSLGLLGTGTTLGADLSGLTLAPGVYTVPEGISNLTGTLTLDGLGNANAFWVFQMPTTLITSSGSVVNVINTGAGAGVYWNVGSSATLGSTTSFQGNILALTSISLNSAATIGCGRALADVGAVTMINNTLSTGCTNTTLAGSNGLSGGLDIPVGGGTPVPLPSIQVAEPTVFLLFALGLLALFFLDDQHGRRQPPSDGTTALALDDDLPATPAGHGHRWIPALAARWPHGGMPMSLSGAPA